MTNGSPRIAAVIPCYKVKDHVLAVIAGVGPEVERILVVDDACPQHTGDWVESQCLDPRVRVLRHSRNQGVGGAVITGYQAALEEGLEIMVKLDGDGQADPAMIPYLVEPLLAGEADYTKGNRFYDLEMVRRMPKGRLLGNAVLSFMTKFSSGYWNIFDPTNGFTAIHAEVAQRLPLAKISRGYFFETDMLFRLNTLRAVVVDLPMDARYGEEISNLKISKVIGEFLVNHLRNFAKRIFYNYYLRDMSLASFELPIGLAMLGFGVVFGVYHWLHSIATSVPSLAGTVMLAAVPVIVGIQLILAFLGYDIRSVPTRPLHRLNTGGRKAAQHEGL